MVEVTTEQRVAKIEGIVEEHSKILDSINQRFISLENKLDDYWGRLDSKIEITRQELSATRRELDSKIEGLRLNLESKIEGVRQELVATRKDFGG